MKAFVKKLIKSLAYFFAGIVILLAIAVGLFRLFLPRLPEYQEQIKVWASDAIGINVEFSGMDARWGLSGPELEFFDAELIRPDNQVRIIAAEEVSVSVALIRLVAERTVAIDRILVRESDIEIRQLEDGSFWVQGGPPDSLLPAREGAGMPAGGSIEFVGEDVRLQYLRPGDERPRTFDVSYIGISRDDQRIAINATSGLPEQLGDEVSVSATYLAQVADDERYWDISLQTSKLDLAGLSSYLGDLLPGVTSGVGDIDLAIALADGKVRTAAAEIDIEGFAVEETAAIDIRGNLEFRKDLDGWLIAANRLRVSTDENNWPEMSFRLDTGFDTDGNLALLDARADYVNLGDFRYLSPFLDETTAALVDEVAPQGQVRNLVATVSGLGSDVLSYALSADLIGVGFDGRDGLPGVRGFSGLLRADTSGGRLEIDSSDMALHLFDYLSEPVELDSAQGTVIWRRSGDRTTVLSDNISIRNGDIESNSNIQLTMDADAAPVIDLASNWSLTDLGSAKRYIPENILHPNLYRWFQNALLSGRIDNGSTRLYGPLDKFPFDNDEGRFLLEATVEDADFRYLNQWPTAELVSLDVVLDNTRLYTERNLVMTEGREIQNSRVEIGDLRDPLLTIEGTSTGDMQSLLAFARNSPINLILGNQLDKVQGEGQASTELTLTVPLKRWREFEVTTRVFAENATLNIAGLNPPIEGLQGTVQIEKDRIFSEDLSGRFLDEAIEIDLRSTSDDFPGYRAVANVKGSLTAENLLNAFDIPAQSLLQGRTEYQAAILFPGGGGEDPQPLAIGISTELEGISVNLPEPFGKPAEELQQFNGDIRFVTGGQQIATAGRTDNFAWNVLFQKDDAWDFERGTLALGRDAVAEDAETRGLHIRGEAEKFYLDDWLDTSANTEAETGVIERIRSTDIVVNDLRLLGQRFENHHVRMDRSARDWLIQVDGDMVKGSISLPYEFSMDTTLVLDMERLVLPGDDEDDGEGEQVDPRKLPSISLKTGEFALGERFFGAVEADLQRTEEGLVAGTIVAIDDSFEIFGNGSWIVDDQDPTGFRTFAVGGLRSTDIKSTMTRLNYEPGINGKELSVLSDVSWSGGPDGDFLKTLDGEVQLKIGPGQLDEVDPGAGRVFGLMSIVALPRRLSLDFSDVFQKGFGFDQIEGTFRIEQGDTYTCNLSLEGPAAAIGIVGRAGLNTRDYEQSAIISANFGNSLPLAGLAVAGPQAAAALLIFSQIFKKPLQDLSQVYYDVGGSWDEPNMQRSDAASFTTRSTEAGCIADPAPESE